MKLKLLFTIASLLFSLGATAVTLSMQGNQGTVIQGKHDVVIIDALYQHYAHWEGFSYDKSLLNKDGLTKFAGKSLTLAATHVHRDHFHPQLIGEHLDSSETSRFLGGQQTVESIKEDFINEHRISARIQCLSSPDCDATYQVSETTTVKGISTIHNHATYDWVENIAMLVTIEGKGILHLGDSALNEANIATLKDAADNPHSVIIPYWFLMAPDLLETFLKELTPEVILVAHYPEAQFQSLKAFMTPIAQDLQQQLPKSRFELLLPGESLDI